MKRFFQACFCFLMGGLILAFPSVLEASSGTWNVDADGNWNNTANWTATFPNGATNTATLGSKITADRVITLGQNIQVSSLTFNDNNKYTVTGANTLTVSSASSGTITESGSGAGLISSAVSNNGNALTLNGAGTGTITISGVLSGAGALKVQSTANAVWVLSNANTYGGATTMTTNGGILNIQNNTALSSGTMTVGGATTSPQLQLQGGLTGVANAITINGYGISGTGAIRNIQDNNTISGTIAFAISSGIASESGTLTLSGVLSGAVDKRFGYTGGGGGGTIVLSGSSANTGAASSTLQSGTLVLNKTGVNAITGTFNVGNNDAGGDRTVVARLDQSNQILDTAAVDIWGTGVLNINGMTETVAALQMQWGDVDVGDGGSLTITTLSMLAGNITTGTGTLHLGGDVTGNADGQTAGISGNLDLGSSTRTFTLADGTTTDPDPDMYISAVVSGSGGLTKAGAGKLALAGANTYTGTTTVSAGVLNIQNSAALGDVSGNTSITSGAALELQGNITVASGEDLTLNGTGISSNGGLRNISDDNTWAGLVALGSASSIGVDAGSLTISGVVSSGSTYALTKVGAGTLVLSGNNTYTGTTTVSAGTLVAGANNALGTTGGATTVSSGASLGFQGDITYSTAEAVSITGTGVSSSGAIKNISGANSFAGAVTMTGDSTIGADAGTLTLSGGISGAFNLTKAGTGTVTLTGTDSFSGSTTINAGTLEAGAANALGSTSGVTINTGGTLLFSGTGDRFKNTATVALAGGTIDMNNKTEVMGAMTLSGNSVITLHSDGTAGDLTFASATFSSGTLTINGWTGTDGSGGTDDRIFITASPSQAFLDSVTFTTFGAGATWLSGELVPVHHDVPEPSTVISGLLLVGLFALTIVRARQTDAATH